MPTNRPAAIVRPLEGRYVDVAGDRYRFIAAFGETNGRYAVWEAVVPPGGGPPPHVHTREEEGFYILEGEIVFYADGKRVVASAGSYVNAPLGGEHSFRNESDRPARMLILIAPGGLEEMFVAIGDAVADPNAPMTPFGDDQKRRLLETAPKYGITLRVPGH
jgi:mannose-6-phosphate isomerase-like protein (cupin superfamily)